MVGKLLGGGLVLLGTVLWCRGEIQARRRETDRAAELAAAHGIREIDLLPFHRLGESKYAVIQQPYTMPDATVPQEHIDALAALLRQRGFIVSIGG